MIDFENNLYEFNEKKFKLKFYSDEFEKLLSQCGISLDNIEINMDGDIYCFTNIKVKKIDCVKFEKILKDNIPHIQDIILNDDYFILIFNLNSVELF